MVKDKGIISHYKVHRTVAAQKEEINLLRPLFDKWVLSIHLAKAPLNQLQVSPLQPCKLLSPTFEGKAMGLLYVKT